MLKRKKLLKKPSGLVLDLTPTPWYPAKDFSKHPYPRNCPFGREYNRDAVEKFFVWLLANYPDGFAKYQLARDLDVHRIVIDEWIYALWHNYVLGTKSKFTNNSCLEIFYPDKRMISFAKKYYGKDIKIKPCSDYDPWTDRTWDEKFYDIWEPYFIDTTVDKYYDVFKNEEALMGEPVRKGFKPLISKRGHYEHPIHFKEKTEAEVTQKNGRPNPPPKTRKKEIKELCYSGKQEVYLSWLSSVYFDESSDRKVERSGKKILQKRKKGGIKRRKVS